jgi:methylmalonyl-CoA carboxyltransferase 1.3S subunit
LKLQITIDGRAYVVDVELIEEEELAQPQQLLKPPETRTQSLAPADLNGDSNVCRSPVNGLVFKVNVASGQSVEAGAVVLILEAMKMETNIAAPRTATVRAVHVKPGDPVKTNQILVEFE